MLYKQKLIALTMLFILTLSSTFLSFATDIVGSGENSLPSGDTQNEIQVNKSGDLDNLPSIDEATSIPFNYIDMQYHWANYSASHLANRNIIVGEQIGENYYFYPDKVISKGDFMLYLLAITKNNNDINLEIPTFSFADESNYPSWLLSAAKLAYAKGIIKGASSDNKLYLNLYNNLTRAEAVAMINNVLKLDGKDVVLMYSDKDMIPAWTMDSIKALTGYKIIQGDGNYFEPNRNITKAEAVEMCFKVLKQMEVIDLK